jgi:hypothetical protein
MIIGISVFTEFGRTCERSGEWGRNTCSNEASPVLPSVAFLGSIGLIFDARDSLAGSRRLGTLATYMSLRGAEGTRRTGMKTMSELRDG